MAKPKYPKEIIVGSYEDGGKIRFDGFASTTDMDFEDGMHCAVYKLVAVKTVRRVISLEDQ